MMLNEIKIQEVGPRDGLQKEKTILSPIQRSRFIKRLMASGLTRIQVGSFVNPKRVPQMAHTDEVLRLLDMNANVRFSVLALNLKGVESAIRSGVRHVELFVSASETHSVKNGGMSIDGALKSSRFMIKEARDAGLTITTGVMCAFGCEFEGRVESETVKRIIEHFTIMQPEEVCLADTTGLATPDLIESTLQEILTIVDVEKISLHLHDTHGNAEKNLFRALDLGVRMFDSSTGGLGGCPFIPGAAGNIATERMVELLHERGFATGVDLNRLLSAGHFIKDLLDTGN